jgi:hypothetical protein
LSEFANRASFHSWAQVSSSNLRSGDDLSPRIRAGHRGSKWSVIIERSGNRGSKRPILWKALRAEMRHSFRKRIDEIRERMIEGIRRQGGPTREWPWVTAFDELLPRVQDARALTAFALDDARNNRERSVAIWTLGKFGAKTAIEPLLRLLQQSDGELSHHAANALCDIRDIAAVPKLAEIVLGSSFIHAREGAAWALHKVIGRGATSALVKAALHDPAPLVRVSATHSLISYPSKRTFAALTAALSDPSIRVISAAIFAVHCLATKKGIEVAVPKLRELVRNKTIVPENEREEIVRDARDALDGIRWAERNKPDAALKGSSARRSKSAKRKQPKTKRRA